MPLEKKPVPKACIEAATQYMKRMNRPEKGQCVRMCDVCGHMEWVSSSNDYEGVTVVWKSEDYSERPCASCNDASRRAPEVMQWVLGALTMMELRCACLVEATLDKFAEATKEKKG